MWAVLLGTVVGGVFTLLGGVVGQIRQDRRLRRGSADLLRFEVILNAHAMETYLEAFGEDPHHEERLAEAAKDMVVHSSTAIWREHGADLISLFPYDFRETLVATYASLISNEVDPGHHRHATWDAVEVLRYASGRLEPHTRSTWVDRFVWRLP